MSQDESAVDLAPAAPPAMTWPFVSLREAARQLGVTHPTISRQIRGGIIPNHGTLQRPLVNVEEARQAREATLLPEKRDNWKAREPVRPIEAASAPAEPSELQKARLATEQARGRKAQIELAQLEGRLLDRAEVHATVFGCARALRAALLALSGRIASDLASLTEPAAVRARLDAAHRALLDDFVTALRAEGVEEEAANAA